MAAKGEWVRIADLVDDPDCSALLAIAITELGIAESLALIHGRERGVRKYVQMGGRVRVDAAGEPVILRRP